MPEPPREPQPEPLRPSGYPGPVGRPGRPWLGLLVGVGGLALVAVPAFWTFLFAYAGFSGCFLECSRPQPLVGAVWALVTLLLVATPVAAGVAVGRARSPRPMLLAAGLLGLLLVVMIFV